MAFEGGSFDGGCALDEPLSKYLLGTINLSHQFQPRKVRADMKFVGVHFYALKFYRRK